jgi:hypothetical protein
MNEFLKLRWHQEDGIAVVVIDNPPVNTIDALLHYWIKVEKGSAEGRGTFDGWIDER